MTPISTTNLRNLSGKILMKQCDIKLASPSLNKSLEL